MFLTVGSGAISFFSNLKWTIDFDIAAFFIDLILYYVFISYKNFATRQNRIYRGLLLISWFSTVTDIAAAIAGTYCGEKFLLINYAVHIIHMIVQNMVPAVYCLFSYSMVFETGKLELWRKLAICVPYIVCVLCIIITPCTGLMFTLKKGVYERGV